MLQHKWNPADTTPLHPGSLYWTQLCLWDQEWGVRAEMKSLVNWSREKHQCPMPMLRGLLPDTSETYVVRVKPKARRPGHITCASFRMQQPTWEGQEWKQMLCLHTTILYDLPAVMPVCQEKGGGNENTESENLPPTGYFLKNLSYIKWTSFNFFFFFFKSPSENEVFWAR